MSTYKDKLCIVKDKDKDLLPNNYVHTTANEEGIQPKKREQNNADNSFDFIYQKRDKAAMEGLSDDNKMPVACASVQNILKRGSNGQRGRNVQYILYVIKIIILFKNSRTKDFYPFQFPV